MSLSRDLEEKAEMDAWRNNVAYFNRLRHRIGQDYCEDTYVVIRNESIVDSGKNQFGLAKKYKRDKSVLIACIRASDRGTDLPSPEFIE